MTTAYTRQSIASEINAQFTTATRADGTLYITCPDDSDARQLVRDVHFQVFDGMLPSDWVYAQTAAIVNLYAYDDNQNESAYELADSAYGDLLGWLGDNLIFAGFVNAVMSEYHYEDIYTAINAGQESALRYMEYAIGEWLDARADTPS